LPSLLEPQWITAQGCSRPGCGPAASARKYRQDDEAVLKIAPAAEARISHALRAVNNIKSEEDGQKL
jgi:hypothetical protein